VGFLENALLQAALIALRLGGKLVSVDKGVGGWGTGSDEGFGASDGGFCGGAIVQKTGKRHTGHKEEKERSKEFGWC
jgi:hypothetical protein